MHPEIPPLGQQLSFTSGFHLEIFFRGSSYDCYAECACAVVFLISAGFPNLSKLAAIALVIPVTTAMVERSFSSMRQVKTRLRNRLGQETLDYAMCICIEGPEKLNDSELEAIVQDWKDRKKETYCHVNIYLSVCTILSIIFYNFIDKRR